MTVFLTNNKQEVMEVLMGPERRRRWSAEEKLAMVRESFEPGKSVSMVARQHGVNPNQLFHWAQAVSGWQPVGCQCRRGSRTSVGAERCAEANQETPATAQQKDNGERDSP
ncbi:transposase-like protein [Paraburkholderia sp. MM5477-R1]